MAIYYGVFSRNEMDGTVHNYSLFHLTFVLASFYIMMTLTNWYQLVFVAIGKQMYKTPGEGGTDLERGYGDVRL